MQWPDSYINKVICGDCLEVMKGIPDGSIDLVVTDPPYGIGFRYDGKYKDDSDGYGDWLWSCLLEAERAVRPGGMIFVYQAMLNCRHFSEWFPRNYRIFAAAKNFVQMRPTAMQYAFDPCIVWWKDGGKPYSLGTSNRDFHIGNTASTMNRGKADGGAHPCPRPLDQIQHILYQWSEDAAIVLDPFCGSGTTAVAAKQLGRKYIGIEINPDYCKIAEERLRQEELFPCGVGNAGTL